MHHPISTGADDFDYFRRPVCGLAARARADDQVMDGAGDEDFTGAGLAEDPRGDVHCDPADVIVQ